MDAASVRADYDGLGGVSKIFQQQSEDLQKMIQNLSSNADQLDGGDWVGVGEKAFYSEWTGQDLKVLQRLQKAMDSSAQITQQIAKIMQTAEQQSSQCFHF